MVSKVKNLVKKDPYMDTLVDLMRLVEDNFYSGLRLEEHIIKQKIRSQIHRGDLINIFQAMKDHDKIKDINNEIIRICKDKEKKDLDSNDSGVLEDSNKYKSVKYPIIDINNPQHAEEVKKIIHQELDLAIKSIRNKDKGNNKDKIIEGLIISKQNTDQRINNLRNKLYEDKSLLRKSVIINASQIMMYCIIFNQNIKDNKVNPNVNYTEEELLRKKLMDFNVDADKYYNNLDIDLINDIRSNDDFNINEDDQHSSIFDTELINELKNIFFKDIKTIYSIGTGIPGTVLTYINALNNYKKGVNYYKNPQKVKNLNRLDYAIDKCREYQIKNKHEYIIRGQSLERLCSIINELIKLIIAYEYNSKKGKKGIDKYTAANILTNIIINRLIEKIIKDDIDMDKLLKSCKNTERMIGNYIKDSHSHRIIDDENNIQQYIISMENDRIRNILDLIKLKNNNFKLIVEEKDKIKALIDLIE